MTAGCDKSADSLSQKIFEQLRFEILQGYWSSGTQLPGERELARRFDANRHTLREAVRRLEVFGLVSVRHGVGATVADFRQTGTPQLLLPYLQANPQIEEMLRVVEDLLEPRTLLMQQIAVLAVARATESDLQQLRDTGAELGSLFRRGETEMLIAGYWVWLDLFVEAGHSVSIRWLANSLFGAFRDVLDVYPDWWVIDESFLTYLRETSASLERRNESAVVAVCRQYFEVVDKKMLFLLRAYVGNESTLSLP